MYIYIRNIYMYIYIYMYLLFFLFIYICPSVCLFVADNLRECWCLHHRTKRNMVGYMNQEKDLTKITALFTAQLFFSLFSTPECSIQPFVLSIKSIIYYVWANNKTSSSRYSVSRSCDLQ